jgi:hypothetical protein
MNGTCIDISVSRVGIPLLFSAERVQDELSFDAKRVGSSIAFITHRIGDELEVYVGRVSTGLDFSVSLVCSVGKDKDGREVFMVKEGVFLLEDGETFRVIKEDGWLSE